MDDRLKVLVAMQMRYKVSRSQGTIMGEAWLQANPGETWTTLNELLKSSQVVVVGDQLVSAGGAPASQAPQPTQTQASQAPAPSTTTQRMYRGRPI